MMILLTIFAEMRDFELWDIDRKLNCVHIFCAVRGSMNFPHPPVSRFDLIRSHYPARILEWPIVVN